MANPAPLPVVSVILPLFNAASTLKRAMRSVRRQTFFSWELVAVDCSSTDGSFDLVQQWRARDGRIRLARLEENRGLGAACNVALRHARGRFVSYLDQDDEYYPEHLAHVVQFGEQADALVSGYDLLYEDGPANGRPIAWDSAAARDDFFVTDIIAPLGVAHRRELWEKIGGFNELCCSSDWDFWKRPVAHRQFALLEWGTTRRLR
jgi:glycosyltransferase involved in cell wall biosynthesis